MSQDSRLLPNLMTTDTQTVFMEHFWQSTQFRRVDYRHAPTHTHCDGGIHHLICGHTLSDVHGCETSCTLACLSFRRLKCAVAETDENSKVMDAMTDNGTDLADRLKDGEDKFTCSYCWLEEILKRWFYFAQASKLPIGRAIFDTSEVVKNPLPVSLFPLLIEVSRKVDGKVYAWFGPRAVLDAQMSNFDPELNALIAKTFFNGKKNEIPLVAPPSKPSFAMIIRGECRSIREVKLVPIEAKPRKTITWNENPQIRMIPAREPRVDIGMRKRTSPRPSLQPNKRSRT